MQRLLLLLFLAIVIRGIASPVKVFAAAVCYGERRINQFQCTNAQATCLSETWFCPYTGGSYDSLEACNAAGGTNPGTCVLGWGGTGPYPTYGPCANQGGYTASCSGNCTWSCAYYQAGNSCTYGGAVDVGCDMATCQSSTVQAGGCETSGGGATCTTTYGTAGCWLVVADTPTPTPTLAPGVTPSPTPPGSTPTSAPPPATCGNGLCDINETACNCSVDCPGSCIIIPPDGPTPTPTPTPPPSGIIQALAHIVTGSDTPCTTIASNTSYLDGTVMQFSPSSPSTPAPQTQTGGQYVTFTSLPEGTYTLAPSEPSGNYVLQNACWTANGNPPYSTGLSAYSIGSGIITWELGYTLGTPWAQTQGGDVYAASTLRSYVPSGTSPRSFILNGAGGSPGVATYGTSYDFNSDPVLKGETYVSSTDWLTNQTRASVNWYEYFWRKLGGGTTADSFADLGAVTKPASRTTPYYVVGDMTTSGNWVVGDGENIIFIVNGNLTLGGNVTITGSGFASFIVNGTISVSPSVGGLYTSSTPVIEGIYITSPAGTFQTGASSVVGKERLVLQGMFVAGSFLLQRDLENAGTSLNTTTAAELFLYNPQLLFTMPDSMRDVPITWEEVAP